jgi:hypothetical protein
LGHFPDGGVRLSKHGQPKKGGNTAFSEIGRGPALAGQARTQGAAANTIPINFVRLKTRNEKPLSLVAVVV